MSWKIRDAVFVGDTLFMPGHGSVRCDFPGGSAAVLCQSIQRRPMPPACSCRDHRPDGRPLAFETTVGEQKSGYIHIDARTTREGYIAFRQQKDASLPAPTLILPSLQVNIRAGELTSPAANGVSFPKIPVDLLGRGSCRCAVTREINLGQIMSAYKMSPSATASGLPKLACTVGRQQE